VDRLRQTALAVLVIAVCATQVTLRSEDPNGTALASVTNVLANTGGDLSQYRPLSAYAAVGLQTLFGLPSPPFEAMRFVQCLLLFALAYVYYGQLGIHSRWRLAGIGLLTGLISLQLGTLGPNGYSLDRFLDTIFYLVAGILVLSNRAVWIPGLIGVAIANRETAVFMPTLVLARYSFTARKPLIIACVSWVVAAIVYLAIHVYYGPHPRTEDSYFGPNMFLHSVSMPGQTAFFLAAITILPLLVVLVLDDVDPYLRRLFWMVVPLWFAIHVWAARLGEGLMYLAPLALIGVPLVLQGLPRRLESSAVSAPLVAAPLQGRPERSAARPAPVAQAARRLARGDP
jgi:hypothetical protein